MSANGNFTKDPNETDVEQFDRVLKELKKSYERLGKITDELTKGQFTKLISETNRIITADKRLAVLQKIQNQQSNDLTKRLNARINVITKTTAHEIKLQKLREGEARQRQKDKMELQRQHAQDVTDHILLRKRLAGASDKLNFFTGALTKGLGVGQLGSLAFEQVVQAYNRQQTMNDLKSQAIQNRMEYAQEAGKQTPDQDVLQKLDDALTRITDKLEQTDKKMAGKTAQGILGQKGMSALESIGQFGKKHAMGIVLGVASAGLLLGVFKKALDVSPVFQSVKKLLEFGFMLILRPIGDFVGFILRPVVVALMRNFIIPFYRTVYPFFREWGTAIGDALAGDGGYLALIATGILTLVGVFAGGKILDKILKAVSGGKWGFSLLKGFQFGNPAPNPTNGGGNGNPKVDDDKSIRERMAGIKESFSKFVTSIRTALNSIKSTLINGVNKILLEFFNSRIFTIVDDVKLQLKTFWTSVRTSFSSIRNMIEKIKLPDIVKPDNIRTRISSFALSFNTLAGKISSGISNMANGIRSIGNFISNILSRAKDMLSPKNIIKGIPNTGILGKIFTALGLYDLAVAPEMIIPPANIGTDMSHLTAGYNYLVNKYKGDTTVADKWYANAVKDKYQQPTGWNQAGNRRTDNPLGFLPTIGDMIGGGLNYLFNGYAEGGIINEPIIGVGKSGKGYMFGEKGAEIVTPVGKANNSQSIVINVYGDMNQQTMAEFERKVLQVLRQSNARRGI